MFCEIKKIEYSFEKKINNGFYNKNFLTITMIDLKSRLGLNTDLSVMLKKIF